MRILRTDEARFAGLPDYPFSAHYLDVEPGLPVAAETMKQHDRRPFVWAGGGLVSDGQMGRGVGT